MQDKRNENGQFCGGDRPWRRKNYTGQRFGALTVQSMLYAPNAKGKTIAKCVCLCDCGEMVVRTPDSLKRGGYPSCGCKRTEVMQRTFRKDLTGQRFGRLVVKRMIWSTNQRTKCECVCDCGNTKTVCNADLLGGHTKSCGCLHSEVTSATNTKSFAGRVSAYGVKLVEPVEQNQRGVWRWKCICGVCGKEFLEIPARVLNGHVRSCGCIRRSANETLIEKWLTEHNVHFVPEYSFQDCRSTYRLRFDFAILGDDDQPTQMIEYDGEQHFRPVNYFGGVKEFEKRQAYDAIKNSYCREHNIPLLRISYRNTPEHICEILQHIINP